METNLVKRAFLYVFSGGVILGIFFAFYISKSLWSFIFMLLVFFLVGILLWFRGEKEAFYIGVIIILGIFIGFYRLSLADRPIDDLIVKNNGENVSITGTVVLDPEDRLGRREYVIDDILLGNNEEEKAVDGRVLVRGARVPEFQYGDVVSWEGKLDIPEAFATDNGRIFDYPGYLKKDGIQATLSFAEGEYVGEGERSFIKSYLYKIKHVYLNNIDKVVPAPESVLAGGLLLGERGSFGEDLATDFRRAGLIHIVVLSGYNIAIISEYALFIFRKKFRKNISMTLAGLFIVLFALLVGGGATVVRASIMGLLVLLSRGGSRRYNITRALTFTTVLMIIYNPFTLILDISFHLSLLATVALIYVAPIVEKYIKLPEAFGVREAGIATLSTQIFVLPYLIYRMGEVSVIAPIVNILVLPVIPVTMLFAFIVGLVGTASYLLSYVVSFVLTPLLSYTIFMTEFFARLPFASFVLPEISIIFTLVLYALLIFGIWKMKQKTIEKNFSSDTEAFEVVEYQILRSD